MPLVPAWCEVSPPEGVSPAASGAGGGAQEDPWGFAGGSDHIFSLLWYPLPRSRIVFLTFPLPGPSSRLREQKWQRWEDGECMEIGQSRGTLSGMGRDSKVSRCAGP